MPSRLSRVRGAFCAQKNAIYKAAWKDRETEMCQGDIYDSTRGPPSVNNDDPIDCWAESYPDLFQGDVKPVWGLLLESRITIDCLSYDPHEDICKKEPSPCGDQ